MKIGFDAKRAAQNATGLGNYSRFVIRTLAEHAPENDYHLYMPRADKTQHLAQLPPADCLHRHFPQGGVWAGVPSLWRTWGMAADLRRDGIELYHGLSNELPETIAKAGCRSVVTIHDLIFIHCPEYYKPIDRAIYRHKFAAACRRADRIVAVSEYTKGEIVRFFGVDDGKIDVVYQGCDPAFAAGADAEKLNEVRRKYALPEEFVLYVGSIERRKNLMLVADALRLMAERGRRGDALPRVVAVGRHTGYADEIAASLNAAGIDGQLTMLHGVPFADLPAIYRLATVFAYPSRIEGFGIPLLEATASGLPSVACTGSCLEEAAGPGAIYVAPDSPADMADALDSLLASPDRRQRMVAEGQQYAQRFADDRLAADMMAVYRKCL